MATGKSEITVKLPNGATLAGRVENVRKMLKDLGYEPNTFLNKSGYYYSNSRREYILISGMNTVHLRNAIGVLYTEWLQSLKTMTNKEMVRALSSGPENLLPLVEELFKRKDE